MPVALHRTFAVMLATVMLLTVFAAALLTAPAEAAYRSKASLRAAPHAVDFVPDPDLPKGRKRK
jgi:hypothetical protein